MRKKIFAVAAACAAAISLGACTTSGSDDEYTELNAMLDLNYSKIILTVTNTFEDTASLTSEYVMEYSDGGVTVKYSVERFTSISLDAPASDNKTTLTGEAVIKDGVVTGGENVNLPATIAEKGLTFKGEYFANAELTGVYLKADVTDPDGFTGSSLNCADMKVYATFLEMFYEIEITYVGETGNAVECAYRFFI